MHAYIIYAKNLGACIISVKMKSILCVQAMVCAMNGGATQHRAWVIETTTEAAQYHRRRRRRRRRNHHRENMMTTLVVRLFYVNVC